MVTFLQASTSSVWIHGRNKGLYKGRSQRDKNRTRTPTCLDYILDYTYIVETRDIIVTLLLILPLLLSFFFLFAKNISLSLGIAVPNCENSSSIFKYRSTAMVFTLLDFFLLDSSLLTFNGGKTRGSGTDRIASVVQK